MQIFDIMRWNFCKKFYILFASIMSFIIGYTLLDILLSFLSLNGKDESFCLFAFFIFLKRGVMRLDSLSYIFFVIIDDIIRRYIFILVNKGFLSLLVGLRGALMMSHVLHVDDVIICCR